MSDKKAVQDKLQANHPIRGCYGCGADNPGGLHLKSFVEGDKLVGRWRPQEHHHAYPGYLNGGIAATLIDCHAAWTAFVMECREKDLDIETSDAATLPAGVTRAMTIEFLKPAPMNGEIVLRSNVIRKGQKSRTVACSLYVNDMECVRGEVTIVMANL